MGKVGRESSPKCSLRGRPGPIRRMQPRRNSLPKRTQRGRNNKVELDEEDERDTRVGAEDAEQRAEGVERLGDEIAAPVRVKHGRVHILSREPCPHRIVPAAEEGEADEEDVEPVDRKDYPTGHEL